MASGLLILGAPLIGLMALAIRLESPGNPFFIQTRVGRHGRAFRLIKMRTLYLESFGIDLNAELSLDSPRITRVGRWLRRSKLDEWPQLLNVLMGHMSMVGPRPYIPEQMALYPAQQQERWGMRPGLSGAVQVSGNTALDWPERFAIDRWYIQHWSWGLDLRILLLTLSAVLAGESRAINRLDLPAHYFAPGHGTGPGTASLEMN